MSSRALLACLLLVSTAASAEPVPPNVLSPSTRALHAVLIGSTGLVLASAYTVGAVLLGDQPEARGLAIPGGVLVGGVAGASIGLGIGATQENPGSMASYILRPVLGGLLGALVGGALAGLGAWQPGVNRTITHGFIVGLVLSETVLLEWVRLSKF